MAAWYLRTEINPLLNGNNGANAGRTFIEVVAECQHDLGWMAYDASQQRLATEYFRRALRSATLGELGWHAEALPLQQRALALTETALGPDHPDTAIRLGNLAAIYGALGRHAEAFPLHKRALAVTEAALGPDHPDTAFRLDHLANAYEELGQLSEAQVLRQRSQQASIAPQGDR
jgi:tetratricopeptide (TPR) repeat protein